MIKKLLCLSLSFIFFSPLYAAISISKVSEVKVKPATVERVATTENSTSEHGTDVSPKRYKTKRKVVSQEKNEKLIQGYRTRRDRRGREKTEYVYGVVKKGNNNNLYTGYLYGENNKKTFVYGDPSTGSMEVQQTEAGAIKTDSKDAYTRGR